MKMQTNQYPTPLLNIVEFCAEYFKITPQDMKMKTRKRKIVQPRHFSRYLSRKYLGGYYSLAAIGSVTGCDHSMVLSSCKAVSTSIEAEKNIKGSYGQSFHNAEIEFVESKLGNIILSARAGRTKLVFNGNNMLRRQEYKLIKKDKVIASMYNEFLKLSSDIKNLIDQDQLMSEGYLKQRAKQRVEDARVSIRNIKLSML